MKKLKANITIEAAVIVPLILMVLAVIISILFYYHDKNVIKGLAYETAMIFSNEKEVTSEEIEEYFREHLGRKMLVFSSVNVNTAVEDEEIQISCSASRRFMKVEVEAKVRRTQPEVWIRRIRLAKKLGNQVGEE